MKELLEYILFRLPIWAEEGELSLEGIAREFKLILPNPELTQEEIAEFILKNTN